MGRDPLVELVRNVFGYSALPEDPLTSGSYRRVGADVARIFGRFAYRSEVSVGVLPKVVEVDAVGDTLLLDELVGSEALHVKVGDWGNPFLRMEEGDSLTRRFDKVWVTTGAAPDVAIPGLTRSIVEATFINSWGPVKSKGDKSNAFRRGFKTFRGVAGVVEQSLFAPLVSLSTGASLVFGKRGGTVVVRNRDLSNTLLLRHGIPGNLGSEDYFEIYPGETLTLTVSHRIHSTTDTIIVACVSGTCKYGFAASAFDIDRADLDQKLLPGI